MFAYFQRVIIYKRTNKNQFFFLLPCIPTAISSSPKLPLVHVSMETRGKCFLFLISKNLLVYYCKWCNLIGYTTRYLFVNRYRVTRQGRVFLK